MNQRVQPGLVDSHLDFFLSENRLFFSHNGQINPFKLLPEDKMQQLEAHLNEDEEAMAALDEMRISERVARLQQFARCRFGGNDVYPDLTDEGVFRADFHICPLSGSCKHEGKLCKILSGPDGEEITHREKDVLLLIARGFMQKEIAAALNVEMVTVAKIKKSLFNKTKTSSSVHLAGFAIEHNLIEPSYASR